MEQNIPAKDQDMESRKENLRMQLEGHGIPLSEWGTGKAKTFDHLFNEVEEGETQLVEDQESGELLRQVKVAGVNVFYEDDTGRYRLVEEKQIFKDGRVRERNLDASVSEKMKPGEDATLAVRRALEEELGMTGTDSLIVTQTDHVEDTKISPSYPGLNSRYVKDLFQTEIAPEQYKEDGYEEKQKDKSTFFVWRREG